MLGLAATPASTASLLLNLEGVFTALIACFVFRENFDRRIAIGMALIVAGGALASLEAGAGQHWSGKPPDRCRLPGVGGRQQPYAPDLRWRSGNHRCDQGGGGRRGEYRNGVPAGQRMAIANPDRCRRTGRLAGLRGEPRAFRGRAARPGQRAGPAPISPSRLSRGVLLALCGAGRIHRRAVLAGLAAGGGGRLAARDRAARAPPSARTDGAQP